MLKSYFKLDHTLRRLRAEPTGRYMDDFARTLHTKGYGVWAAQAYSACGRTSGDMDQGARLFPDDVG